MPTKKAAEKEKWDPLTRRLVEDEGLTPPPGVGIPKAPRASTTRPAPIKITRKMCEGIIDAVEAVAQVIGHEPTDPERDAAIRGLEAAAKKSPLIAKVVAGGIDVGDWGVVAVGLGGLAARIATGALARANPERQTVKERVYAATDMAYLLSGQMPDLSILFGPEEPGDGTVDTGATRSADRANGIGENIPGPFATPIPLTRDNAR